MITSCGTVPMCLLLVRVPPHISTLMQGTPYQRLFTLGYTFVLVCTKWLVAVNPEDFVLVVRRRTSGLLQATEPTQLPRVVDGAP